MGASAAKTSGAMSIGPTFAPQIAALPNPIKKLRDAFPFIVFMLCLLPGPPGLRPSASRLTGISLRVITMPEVRFEIPADDLAVLDGYCSATGKARTDVIKHLLVEWSERKLHEATIVLRVAGRNPTGSESSRKPSSGGLE